MLGLLGSVFALAAQLQTDRPSGRRRKPCVASPQLVKNSHDSNG